MKPFTLGLAVGLLALGACGPTQLSDSGSAVDPLLGKSLVADNGTTFIFNANGTVGGVFNGEAIAGTYAADAREVCSVYTAPASLADQEFCSVPAIQGSTVVFNRRDGSQSQPYNIQG